MCPAGLVLCFTRGLHQAFVRLLRIGPLRTDPSSEPVSLSVFFPPSPPSTNGSGGKWPLACGAPRRTANGLASAPSNGPGGRVPRVSSPSDCRPPLFLAFCPATSNCTGCWGSPSTRNFAFGASSYRRRRAGRVFYTFASAIGDR